MDTQLAYDTVTFFEEWLLRQFNVAATDDDILRVRNVAEDLITEDAEYWSRASCTRLYEVSCESLGFKPYAHLHH